jgi:hypothetical protein
MWPVVFSQVTICCFVIVLPFAEAVGTVGAVNMESTLMLVFTFTSKLLVKWVMTHVLAGNWYPLR